MSGQKKRTIIVVKWAGKLSILRALNPLTPNISLATLLTVCHTVLVISFENLVLDQLIIL